MKTVKFNEKKFERLLKDLLVFEEAFQKGMRGCIMGATPVVSSPLNGIFCPRITSNCNPFCAFFHYVKGPCWRNVEWVEFYCTILRNQIILRFEKEKQE